MDILLSTLVATRKYDLHERARKKVVDLILDDKDLKNGRLPIIRQNSFQIYVWASQTNNPNISLLAREAIFALPSLELLSHPELRKISGEQVYDLFHARDERSQWFKKRITQMVPRAIHPCESMKDTTETLAQLLTFLETFPSLYTMQRYSFKNDIPSTWNEGASTIAHPMELFQHRQMHRMSDWNYDTRGQAFFGIQGQVLSRHGLNPIMYNKHLSDECSSV